VYLDVKSSSNGPGCPQARALSPEKNAEIWKTMNEKIRTTAFKESAIDWLSRAVRVP